MDGTSAAQGSPALTHEGVKAGGGGKHVLTIDFGRELPFNGRLEKQAGCHCGSAIDTENRPRIRGRFVGHDKLVSVLAGISPDIVVRSILERKYQLIL